MGLCVHLCLFVVSLYIFLCIFVFCSLEMWKDTVLLDDRLGKGAIDNKAHGEEGGR